MGVNVHHFDSQLPPCVSIMADEHLPKGTCSKQLPLAPILGRIHCRTYTHTHTQKHSTQHSTSGTGEGKTTTRVQCYQCTLHNHKQENECQVKVCAKRSTPLPQPQLQTTTFISHDPTPFSDSSPFSIPTSEAYRQRRPSRPEPVALGRSPWSVVTLSWSLTLG